VALEQDMQVKQSMKVPLDQDMQVKQSMHKYSMAGKGRVHCHVQISVLSKELCIA
jgi:hypothetical protein